MAAPVHAYNAEHGIRRYAVEGLTPHPISVTTLLKTIASPPGLETWLAKKFINAALESFRESQSIDAAVSAGLSSRYDSSPDADFGSSVHLLTEQADLKLLGKLDKIAPVADMKRASGFLKQWEKARDEHSMQILAVEATLVNKELGYAGTADRIVIIPAISQDPIVLDIKSGKSIYPSVALQCAALANCDHIMYDDGSLLPIPWKLNRTLGVAAHVRARSCHLISLDLEKAWPLFKPLPSLAMYRAEQVALVGDILEPDEIETLRADLRLRISNLPPDLARNVRAIIKEDETLTGGDTKTWDETQLRRVEQLFLPFEKEARERFEHVVRLWGDDRGSMELKTKVLAVSEGRTTSVSELRASEIDVLIKTF